MVSRFALMTLAVAFAGAPALAEDRPAGAPAAPSGAPKAAAESGDSNIGKDAAKNEKKSQEMMREENAKMTDPNKNNGK